MDSRDIHASSGTTSPLSPSGQARREAMLTDFVGHMRRRRAQRRAARAIAVILVGTTSVWLVLRPSSIPTPIPNISLVPHQAPIATNATHPLDTSPQIRTLIVKTDPISDQRLGFETKPAAVAQTIGDDQLMDALVEAGRPSGLVRIGARVTVVDSTGTDWSDPPRPKTQGQLDSPQSPAIRSGNAAV